MIDSEKLLKDVNLRLARFGNSDVTDERSLSPDRVISPNLQRLYREIVAKLVYKIE